MSYDPEMTKLNVDTIIAKGESLSNSFCKKHYKEILIVMPAVWTAADITFQVSDDDVTFGDLYIAENAAALVEVNIKAPAALQVIALAGKLKEALKNCLYVKIRSGVTGTPVNQTDLREFEIVLMR